MIDDTEICLYKHKSKQVESQPLLRKKCGVYKKYFCHNAKHQAKRWKSLMTTWTGSTDLLMHSLTIWRMMLTRRSSALMWGSQRIGLRGSALIETRMASLKRCGPFWNLEVEYYSGCEKVMRRVRGTKCEHKPEQCGKSGVSYEATLVNGCQDGYLVMEGLAKPSAMIQMQWCRVVSKHLKETLSSALDTGVNVDVTTTTHFEGLVVVAIHVAHEEVKYSHVHEVKEAASFIVWVHLLHQLTVLVICRRKSDQMIKTCFRIWSRVRERIAWNGQTSNSGSGGCLCPTEKVCLLVLVLVVVVVLLLMMMAVVVMMFC
ncbi:hypothetical protein E2C01_007993 [Portunus trituberculatus]|uniref:Uncharacterized protein n=1 Tax=Portunus trituberculatus TaxID=210409 RepID=A0A5B7D153_PORTR|nr:hypothetical protein [Portunus trituberculatus]